MSNYTKATNFATKDSLPSGNPSKIVKGTEINDEFDAIETALNSKADINSPVFTGDPRAPTPPPGDSDTSLATTAFVDYAVSNLVVCSSQIGTNCVTADELNVSGNGTSGDFLISDGDGSFSWQAGIASRIQAPSTTDPTTRDNGSALQEGDIYYNTASDELFTYDGSAWNPITASYPYPNSSGVVPVGGFTIMHYLAVYVGGDSSWNGYTNTKKVGTQFTLSSLTQMTTYGTYYSNTGCYNGFYTYQTNTAVHNYGTWVVLGATGSMNGSGDSNERGALLAMRIA